MGGRSQTKKENGAFVVVIVVALGVFFGKRKMIVLIDLTEDSDADISYLDNGDVSITIGDLEIQMNYDLKYKLWQKMVHFMMAKDNESVKQTFKRVVDPHDE